MRKRVSNLSGSTETSYNVPARSREMQGVDDNMDVAWHINERRRRGLEACMQMVNEKRQRRSENIA